MKINSLKKFGKGRK